MVDTVTINSLEREIQKYRTRLEELENQQTLIEIELPIVKGNLEALIKALEIFQGKKAEPSKESDVLLPSPSSSPASTFKKGSMPDLAYSVLKAEGKPLSMPELFERVKGIKQEIKRDSFEAGIYSVLQQNKVFKRYDGKIGLLEWK